MSDFTSTIVTKLGILLIVLGTAAVLLVGGAAIAATDLSLDSYLSSGEVTPVDGSLYLDRGGQPTVVGAVENDYGSPITNVTVTVVFYEDGEAVETVRTSPLVPTVSDNTVVPYVARATEADPDAYAVELSFDEALDAPDHGLEIVESEEYERTQYGATVTGSVENTGDADAERAEIVVTFYDEHGTVIGVRSDRISPAPLAADEAGEFRVRYSTLGDVPSLGGSYASYSVVVHDGGD